MENLNKLVNEINHLKKSKELLDSILAHWNDETNQFDKINDKQNPRIAKPHDPLNIYFAKRIEEYNNEKSRFED